MPEEEMHFHRCPKYNRYEITADQIEEIAELAAVKALELGKKELKEEIGENTIEFGKNVLEKLFWAIGAVAITSITLAYKDIHLPKL